MWRLSTPGILSGLDFIVLLYSVFGELENIEATYFYTLCRVWRKTIFLLNLDMQHDYAILVVY